MKKVKRGRSKKEKIDDERGKTDKKGERNNKKDQK